MTASQLDYRIATLHPRLSDWREAGLLESPVASEVIEYAPGTHTLTDRIRLFSGQVLRGAGKDQTVLRFTKSLYELLGVGSWSAGGVTDAPGWSTGGGWVFADFASVVGIENLTIELPVHQQAPHFYEAGFNPIFFSKITNGWVKNVRLVNADSGLLCYKLTNCLFENVEMIWPGVTRNAEGHIAHYGVMLGRDCTKVLVDGLAVDDLCRHDTDVANGANFNVFMRSRFKDYVCSHHGGNPHHNLFTDIDVGLGTRVFTDSGGSLSAMPHNGPGEVFWNLRKHNGTTINQLPPFTGQRYWRRDMVITVHTLNILNTDLTKEWVEGLWEVEPANVYLAQQTATEPPPSEPPPMPNKFDLGDTVKSTSQVNVRSAPGTNQPLVGTQPANTTGVVTEGPVPATGFIYWWIPAWGGWVGEDKLVEITPPVDPRATARQKFRDLGFTDTEIVEWLP